MNLQNYDEFLIASPINFTQHFTGIKQLYYLIKRTWKKIQQKIILSTRFDECSSRECCFLQARQKSEGFFEFSSKYNAISFPLVNLEENRTFHKMWLIGDNEDSDWRLINRKPLSMEFHERMTETDRHHKKTYLQTCTVSEKNFLRVKQQAQPLRKSRFALEICLISGDTISN